VLFTADAHRDCGKRFIVSADEKLTAFLELETVTSNDDYQNQARTVGVGKLLKLPALLGPISEGFRPTLR
jgi:hypothetical protein